MLTVSRKLLLTTGIAVLLSGCDEGSRKDLNISKDGISNTQCIEGSLYMGCNVKIGKADNGGVANQTLLDHSKQFSKQILNPEEGVYSLIGYGLSNINIIDAPEGLIVFDTGETVAQAQEHIAVIKRISNRPVKAIVYTHFHYTGGAKAYFDEYGNDIKVWGNELVSINLDKTTKTIAYAFQNRLARHFGLHLPENGPDANVGVGIGGVVHVEENPIAGFVKPTNMIAKEGVTKATIAGLEVEFSPYASDANDSIVTYFPTKDIIVNNHFWPVFANMHTLRGGAYRDPVQWIGGVDFMRKTKPNLLLNVHGVPLSGKQNIYDALTIYRDGIQFIFDQTIRGINNGLDYDDLVEFVRLPDNLKENPYLNQHYGEVGSYVRAVRSGLLGWFANDPIELNPLSKKEEATRIVKLMGGEEEVLKAAQNAYQEKEYEWVGQLTNYLINLDGNAQAKQLKADALRAMAHVTPGATTRNFMLTEALSLEDEIDIMKSPLNMLSVEYVLQREPGTFVQALGKTLNPDELDITERMTFAVNFTDLNEVHGLEIRNSIAEYFVTKPMGNSEVDLELSLSREQWAGLVIGEINPAFAIASGDIAITKGGLSDLVSFFSKFQKMK